MVLKGRAGLAGGGAWLFGWGGGTWHGMTLPGAGIRGHGESLRNMLHSESPEDSEGHGESGAFWELSRTCRTQEVPEFWGHRKPHVPCRARGPWWILRSLWDMGVPRL